VGRKLALGLASDQQMYLIANLAVGDPYGWPGAPIEGATASWFALVSVTGWVWLDPALAAVVAVNIIWTGYAMVRDSVGSLMDKAVDPKVLGRIRGIISSRADGALEAHDLRTRTSGHVTFIEFHLIVPAQMAVEDAHTICDRLEQALRDEVGEAVIGRRSGFR
jgi:divalent metal cation (Fe/Co/Zn/Cd) transporter